MLTDANRLKLSSCGDIYGPTSTGPLPPPSVLGAYKRPHFLPIGSYHLFECLLILEYISVVCIWHLAQCLHAGRVLGLLSRTRPLRRRWRCLTKTHLTGGRMSPRLLAAKLPRK
uniref:Uncharacterized protein n=1 Tax=Helianthus annuus TaxID=4232 RepID=A0A251TQ15_HELAN